jgi:hypothetical protein
MAVVSQFPTSDFLDLLASHLLSPLGMVSLPT